MIKQIVLAARQLLNDSKANNLTLFIEEVLLNSLIDQGGKDISSVLVMI